MNKEANSAQTRMPSPLIVFSHDAHDARFHKRMKMFSDMGFSVSWLAFDRGRDTDLAEEILRRFPGRMLGKKRDKAYFGRAADLAQAVAKLLAWGSLTSAPSLIYCINLDNLLATVLAKALGRLPCRIVYEVADIQSILLRPDAVGRSLRAVERWCLKRTDLVVYTSEHYMTHFLGPVQHCAAPTCLLENKIYPASSLPLRAVSVSRPKEGPIVVGLFGQLKCRRSFEMIRRLAAAFPRKLRFVLRGYPNHDARALFDAVVAGTPNVTYGGPYLYPDDLAALYAEVDLCWGFDFCSPGLNSSWCLANRLYEARYFGVPILVEADTAGGEFVQRLGSGWVFPLPLEASLEAFFSRISPAEIRDKRDHTARLEASAFVLDTDLPGLRDAFLSLAA